MRLDERKLRILRTIIDDYVMTATPIGSRTISKRSELGLSSATIRNEMSDLEEMGFLEQPHTSAGRVPSEKAYRFYVDTMMKAGTLSTDEIAFMRSYFHSRMTEAEEVVAQTAKLLSDLTDYTSMVMSPGLGGVIVTDAGVVRDSFISVPLGCTGRDLERLSNMVTERVKNMPLNEAVEALHRGAGEEMEEQRSCFSSLADSIAHGLAREASRGVVLGGATKLLRHPEYLDVEKASSMLAVLETKEQLYKILSRAAKMEFSITIGSENELPEMQSASVITATYRIAGKPVGSFGVIGPIRMDYAKVTTILNQMGETLSAVLTGMVNPLEE